MENSMEIPQNIKYNSIIRSRSLTSEYYIARGNEISISKRYKDFPGGSDGKASAYNVGNPGSIPGSGRSPGEGNGNPLRYSGPENPMDEGAW